MHYSNTSTVADLVIDCLINEGVDRIWGVPGEETDDLLYAIEDKEIKFIPTRHEQGAAFIAEAYGRFTGKPGVCLSTLGPGATNLVTGISSAYLDQSPVVAITAQGSLDRMHHENHQIIDIKSILKPITKWSATITSQDAVPEIIRKAFEVSAHEPAGPVHIELPESIAKIKLGKSIYPLSLKRKSKQYASPGIIHKAAKEILIAERPIVLVGNEVIRSNASDSLKRFIKKVKIPVINTFMAKGAISDRNDLVIGTIGMGFKDYPDEVIQKADLVIAIGYDVVEYGPGLWSNKDKKLLHISNSPSEIYSTYQPDYEIVGHIGHTLQYLRSHLVDYQSPLWWQDIPYKKIKKSTEFALGKSGFHIPGVLKELRDKMDDDGILISDVGSHKMWIARNFPTYHPNTCIISNGLASMGIAIPAAIAARIARPDSQVVALMGDGGALMNFQELETIVRLNLPITLMVCVDDDYGLISWKQKRENDRISGTQIGNPDFCRLAESFGIKAYHPQSLDELNSAIKESLESSTPRLITINISTDVNQELTERLDQYFKSNIIYEYH